VRGTGKWAGAGGAPEGPTGKGKTEIGG
jgi:hypothetical protein